MTCPCCVGDRTGDWMDLCEICLDAWAGGGVAHECDRPERAAGPAHGGGDPLGSTRQHTPHGGIMSTLTQPTTDRMICVGCNQTIATRADSHSQRLEAMRVHDHECWSHGSTSYIDGEVLRSCVHHGACFRMVRQDGAAL